MSGQAKEYIGYYLAVFVVIYGPVLDIGIGPYADTQFVFSLIVFIYALSVFGVKIHTLQTSEQQLFAICFLLFTYGCGSSVIGYLTSGDVTLHAALRPLRAFVTIIGCYSLIVIGKFVFERKLVSTTMFAIFASVCVHGVVMITQFLSPEFRDTVSQWTFANQVLEMNQNTRMPGLTNGGGSQLSLYQAVGVLLVPFLFMYETRQIVRAMIVVGGVVCLWSIILTGRSGLIFLSVGIPVSVYCLYGVRRAIFALAALGFVFGGAIFLAFGASDFVSLYVGDLLADYMDVAIARSFETFVGEDETVSYLIESHLFFPSDIGTFLFGNPRLVELDQNFDDRIVNSDIGYVRLIFGYGVFGSLLYYCFYLFIITWAGRFILIERALSYFCIIFAVCILAFNFKEVFVLTRIGLSITMLAFFCLTKTAKR